MLSIGQKWKQANGEVVTIVEYNNGGDPRYGLEEDDMPWRCSRSYWRTNKGEALGAGAEKNLVELIEKENA